MLMMSETTTIASTSVATESSVRRAITPGFPQEHFPEKHALDHDRGWAPAFRKKMRQALNLTRSRRANCAVRRKPSTCGKGRRHGGSMSTLALAESRIRYE